MTFFLEGCTEKKNRSNNDQPQTWKILPKQTAQKHRETYAFPPWIPLAQPNRANQKKCRAQTRKKNTKNTCLAYGKPHSNSGKWRFRLGSPMSSWWSRLHPVRGATTNTCPKSDSIVVTRDKNMIKSSQPSTKNTPLHLLRMWRVPLKSNRVNNPQVQQNLQFVEISTFLKFLSWFLVAVDRQTWKVVHFFLELFGPFSFTYQRLFLQSWSPETMEIYGILTFSKACPTYQSHFLLPMGNHTALACGSPLPDTEALTNREFNLWKTHDISRNTAGPNLDCDIEKIHGSVRTRTYCPHIGVHIYNYKYIL